MQFVEPAGQRFQAIETRAFEAPELLPQQEGRLATKAEGIHARTIGAPGVFLHVNRMDSRAL